jgi:hypothetical protein
MEIKNRFAGRDELLADYRLEIAKIILGYHSRHLVLARIYPHPEALTNELFRDFHQEQKSGAGSHARRIEFIKG